MNKMRCFLAIKVVNVKQYQDRIKSISEGLNINIKVVNPANYHFTLHFFGDLDEIDVKKANTIFKTLNIPKFKIVLSETGSLPKDKLKYTRVLFIKPSIGEKNITSIISIIRNKLELQEFKIDKRKPIAHLTVCRIRHGKEIEEFCQKWLTSKFVPMEFDCLSLVFFKSDLQKTGPKYTAMFEYPLALTDMK